MNNQILDDFLTERSAEVMKKIEEEIHKEVGEGICEYFGIGQINELTKDQTDQIKTLHDEGLGYRRIAKQLNEQGIKTIRGNEWGSNNVHSVLKRNKERLERLKVKEEESEIEYGKMELVWLREGESYQ